MDAVVAVLRAGRLAWSRKWGFLVLSLLVFAVSVAFLARLDLLPEPARAVPVDAVAAADAAPAPPAAVEEPVAIEIPSIGLAAAIENPETADFGVLDALLLKGAVRYPGSAKLGEEGNVVLFGHSSYLPVVKNPAYKTFNDIQKLSAGDRVTVTSAGTAYVYAVRSVEKERADGQNAIPLAVAGKALTLVTCNSFATKTDRFVVTADLVESHPLGA